MSIWKSLFGRRAVQGSAVRRSSRRSLGLESLEGRLVLSAVLVTAEPVKEVVALVAPASPGTDRRIELSPSATPSSSLAEISVAGPAVSSSRADTKATEGVMAKFATLNEELIAKTVGNPEDGTDDRKSPVPPDKTPPQPGPGPGPIDYANSRSPQSALTASATVALATVHEPETVEEILNEFKKEFNATEVGNSIKEKVTGTAVTGFWEGVCEFGMGAAWTAAGAAVGGPAGAVIGGAVGAGVGAKYCEGADDWVDETFGDDSSESGGGTGSENGGGTGTGSGSSSSENGSEDDEGGVCEETYDDDWYPNPEDPSGIVMTKPQAATPLPH